MWIESFKKIYNPTKIITEKSEKFYDEYKKIDWIDDSNVGARSIDKQTLIKGINGILKSF